MIAKKTQLLTVAAALLIPIAAQANDTDPELEFNQVLPTVVPITLDGDISDEEWGHAVEIHNPEFSIPKGSGFDGGTRVIFEEHNGGTWEGEGDQSTFTKFLYDSENLYVSFLVVDDFYENGANDPWNGDAAQIMIANEDRDTQVGLYNFALGGVQSDPNFFPVCGPALAPDNGCIVQHEAGPSSVDEINAAIVRGDGITSYEIMISAAALGTEESLEFGQQYGFGVAINDGDEDTPGQKGWGGLGAHALVFGKAPAETVLLVFDQLPPMDVPGDANGDGKVDAADLNILGGNWRMAVAGGIADGDFDESGTVDAGDLNILGGNWQFGVAAPLNAAVPEPSGAVLMILGCFITLVIRRRTT